MPTAPLAESDVCARCAQHSGTCCTLVPGQEEFCFPLSDMERTAMELGGAKGPHFARQANTPAFVDNLSRLFPGEEALLAALFPADGAHDRLAIDQNGACQLLGPAGCMLPRLARPLYCRLFPFWITAGRQLYFDFAQCQAQREAASGPGLARRLGMTNSYITHLYTELRKAWGLPEQK